MQLTKIDIDSSDIETQIQAASNDQLMQLLSDTVTITSKYIWLLSKVWKELENRGVDLSHLRSGIAYYLPMVAEAKIDASAVLAFAGQQLLLREISLMPIELQKSLANGKLVDLVEHKQDAGEFITKKMPIKSISSRYYSQIFDMGRILSESEQIEYLKKKTKRKKKKHDVIGQPIKKKNLSYNKEKDAFYINNTGILFTDIIKGLALKYKKEPHEIKALLDTFSNQF